jgi:hypothetical protein
MNVSPESIGAWLTILFVFVGVPPLATTCTSIFSIEVFKLQNIITVMAESVLRLGVIAIAEVPSSVLKIAISYP